jgi:hypothetical protein
MRVHSVYRLGILMCSGLTVLSGCTRHTESPRAASNVPIAQPCEDELGALADQKQAEPEDCDIPKTWCSKEIADALERLQRGQASKKND